MAHQRRYRIRNWKDYNKALISRGSLTVWFDQESIECWHKTERSGERGRPRDYSDQALLCVLTLRAIFHLPLRAAQGFVTSLLQLLQLPLRTPHYTILCRRQNDLALPKQSFSQRENPLHLVVDSSGVKLYGEGEWKVKMHGKTKRRTWRKLHIGLDEKTHDILAAEVTEASVHDCEVLGQLLQRIEENIHQVTADGAYDTHDCYAAAIAKNAIPCFPPRQKASRHKPIDEAWRLRNHTVSQVHYHSMQYWKRRHHYHRRSLAETAFFRLKKIFGSHVAARLFKHQAVELGLRCHILNRMNQLGMPLSEKH